ncbi:MAG: monovalent cation/H+ antiporter subunit D family protein [Magnetovibrionaceae bacterium]
MNPALHPEVLIIAAMVLPLVGALLIWIFDKQPNARDTSMVITSIITFLVVSQLFPMIAAGERPAITLFEMMPGLTIAFEVEPLGMLFAGIASFLWIATSLYAIGYMRGHHEKNQTRFFICFAIAISSAIGAAFSGNMLTLFVFYEVLTVSTFPLVTHAGTEKAKRAGRVYLGILIGTSILFQLTAVVWTYVLAGTLDFEPGGILEGKASATVVGVLIGLYAYGIGKAALMPFHRWLPAAMVAPTPVSALLHAVAVVKAGVFTVLKVVIYIFGLELLRDTGASTWIAYVAGFTILVASLVAMTKDNLKARLAYSTVSQLSYIVLAAMLATGLGALGGAMHIAMHAFGKITLFFCAGAIMVASHKTEISQMRGLGRVMPWTFGAFLIGSLSIIGLPPLGGSWSKFYIALGAVETDQLIFVAVLMISSLLNVAYLLPVAIRGFYAPKPGESVGAAHVTEGGGIKEAPLFCVGPLVFTAFASFLLFFYADLLIDFLRPIVEVAP